MSIFNKIIHFPQANEDDASRHAGDGDKNEEYCT